MTVTIATAEACSCLPHSTMQEAFCASDYVSRVKVISKKDENTAKEYSPMNDIIYNVEHIHIYKNASETKVLPKEVATAADIGTCGLLLQNGEEYLLGGTVESDGHLHAHLCGIALHWTEVSPEDKAAFGSYKSAGRKFTTGLKTFGTLGSKFNPWKYRRFEILKKMMLIIVLALSTAAVEVDSCSCLPFNSLEEEYCSSEFVSHLKVTSKDDPNPKEGPRYLEVTYDVEYIHVYKNASYIKEIPKKIVTAGHESTCGVSLTEGGEYLVGGGVGNGYIYASSCGLSSPWAYVPPRDKVALSRYNCSTV
ncbi:unnamed protein product [Cylicocyclus nassatus]|uniref:NTR domain-containing protein n=1 Tax=Cylicocyclus nassatus TaxID=53992 RepID=A0AA36GXC7_CYLNA|nr:unnamed protein product [Cylicocyclus nassatus]